MFSPELVHLQQSMPRAAMASVRSALAQPQCMWIAHTDITETIYLPQPVPLAKYLAKMKLPNIHGFKVGAHFIQPSANETNTLSSRGVIHSYRCSDRMTTSHGFVIKVNK